MPLVAHRPLAALDRLRAEGQEIPDVERAQEDYWPRVQRVFDRTDKNVTSAPASPRTSPCATSTASRA